MLSNMDLFKVTSLFVIIFNIAFSFSIPGNEIKKGTKLLTPLIENGFIREAKELAANHNFTEAFGIPFEIRSYSGFITVDAMCKTNLFFWYFPAMNNAKEAPLILWHGGGPGSSGLTALFHGAGPFQPTEDGDSLSLTRTPWTLARSVVFIDSPAGTGFSYTGNPSDECRVKSTSVAAKQVRSLLLQFYQLFPYQRSNDLYLMTGSYGGKFGPAIAYEIYTQNKDSSHPRINVKGVLIGSGWTDPISQIDYGSLLFSYGFLDQKQLDFFLQEEARAKDLINKGNWSGAFDIVEPLVMGTVDASSTMLEMTGVQCPMNMEKDDSCYHPVLSRSEKFLNQSKVRSRLLGGGIEPFSRASSTVYENFRNDIYKSVKPLVEELLNSGEIKILLISNQLDLIVPHSTVLNFINQLNWNGVHLWRNAATQNWRPTKGFKPGVAGYKKSAGNLEYLFLRNCGHIYYIDKPEITFDVVMEFTKPKEGGGVHVAAAATTNNKILISM